MISLAVFPIINISFYYQSCEDLKLYQPWKFPSLVSLPMYPQRGPNNLLRVPLTRENASRSPSLPLINKNPRTSRSKSNFLSTRSDSEPTMCLSLTPQSARRPSIVLTRASVEQEERWNGSIGSRLPSHLSLGSTNLTPTPAPTTPLSMFFNEKSFPPNRSVTPLLFPEHQLQPPNGSSSSMTRSTSEYLSPSPSRQNLSSLTQTKAVSKSQLNLKGKLHNFLPPSASNWSLGSRGCTNKAYIPTTPYQPPPLIRSPSLYVTPPEQDRRERKVMTGVIKMWTKQASLESRV